MSGSGTQVSLNRDIFSDDVYEEYLKSAFPWGTEIQTIDNPVSEDELLRKNIVTPGDIKRLRTYTNNYLCPKSANVYGIEFIRYAVRNIETGKILLDLKAPEEELTQKKSILEIDKINTEAERNKSLKTLVNNVKRLDEITSGIKFGVQRGNIQTNEGDQELKILDTCNNFCQNKEVNSNRSKDDCCNNFELSSEDIDINKIEHSISKQGEVTGDEGELFSEFDDELCNGQYQCDEQNKLYNYDVLEQVVAHDRMVLYNLSPALLFMPTIGALVEFKVGNNEIKNLRMIELHFFKDKLIKTFDFEFGFCIPNSVNSWEHIYQIPKFPSRMEPSDVPKPTNFNHLRKQ